MITLEEYLNDREVQYPITDEMEENAQNLLEKIQLLSEALNIELTITSGYRPEEMIEDKELPGCPHDAHSTCEGIDIHDPDLSVSKIITANPQMLIDCGLWMESMASSKNHLHLQSRAPKSGNRIFLA